MCARRAVRVTSVFSSAAASLRVRTDREVCKAENCVRKTSGKTKNISLSHTILKTFASFSFGGEKEIIYLCPILRCCSHQTSRLTWLDVAIIADNSSPAGVYGEVAGLSFSLTLPLQQLLLLPHLLPVSQEKHSVLQHKVPGNHMKTACRTSTLALLQACLILYVTSFLQTFSVPETAGNMQY